MKQITITIRANVPDDITQDQLNEVASAAEVQVIEPEIDGSSLPSWEIISTTAIFGCGPYTVQRFCTTNDSNGNPRRVFVIRDGAGDIVRTFDDGYVGRPVYRGFEQDLGMKLVDLGDTGCSVTEYKELLKFAGVRIVNVST